MSLRILRIGPAVTVQDMGRPGHMASGLSRGGAADQRALVEGAVLLGQSWQAAVLEMAGIGGSFDAEEDLWIALTGAPMAATLDGRALRWHASHPVARGQRLDIGAVRAGSYGYLHLGGGVAAPSFLGSRATHLTARIGATFTSGERIAADTFTCAPAARILPEDPRFAGGTVRVLPSVHTDRFTPEERARFEATTFKRTARGNRQGVELAFDGAPFAMAGQLALLSEPMLAGDIQMTGAGMPYVLLPECQTTGGYPRIGTVLPDDVPLVAQAPPGHPLRFRFIDHDAGLAAHEPPEALAARLKRQLQPLVRDPRDMPDLLRYQLISGAVSGEE